MDIEQKNRREEVLWQLVRQARLEENELKDRLNKALMPAYWEELNPDLSVRGSRTTTLVEAAPLDSQCQEEFLAEYAKEGYFQTEPMLMTSTTERMRQCVEVLRKEGWPPVFALVYDLFWLAARGPSLVRLLSAILGPAYKQVSHVWVYYIYPRRGATGWRPHTDGLRKRRINVWIPLTDATLDNGCMYIIPRDLAPRGVEGPILKQKSFNLTEVQALLQSSRSLPARAGEYLAWDDDVIHWGSTCLQAGDPRISIAFEFIGEQVDSEDHELPLLDAHDSLPTFAQRLNVIGKGILTYPKFEALLSRYKKLGQRLLEYAE